jgi:4-carboxymuconolactone decarboxylase
MARLADIDPSRLGADDRRIYDEIAGSRGGNARGPFSAWLRLPQVALAAGRFGDAIRLGGILPVRLFELATLVVAAHWRAPYPWLAHQDAALAAGVDPAVAAALRTGREPSFSDPDEACVYGIVQEILQTGTLGAAAYSAAERQLGVDGLVELVTAVGFYSAAALVANVFDVDLPDQDPFVDRARG